MPRRRTIVSVAAALCLLLLAGGATRMARLSADAPAPVPTPIAVPAAPGAAEEVPQAASVTPEPEVAAAVAPESAPASGVKSLGGKRVVLEYDANPTNPTPPGPPPPGDNPAAVARAREAYRRGNGSLFAGNLDDAVTAYREALKFYPGYVAAYRGLGLALSEQGDKAQALKALRVYVRTVPNAADASLIRKRIERLDKK